MNYVNVRKSAVYVDAHRHCPTCGHVLNQEMPGLEVDEDGQCIMIDGRAIYLPNTRFDLFRALWLSRDKFIRRERIYAAMYGNRPDGGPEIKVIDVHLCKLRKEIAGTRLEIITKPCVGYQLRLKDA